MGDYLPDHAKIERYKSALYSISENLDPLRTQASWCFELWPDGEGRKCADILFGADDAIDDSTLALCAFVEMEWPESTDQRQLLGYGFFQALYIQQEAIVAIAHAGDITMDLKAQPATWKLRTLRNRLVGHPAPDKMDWSVSGIFGRGDITPNQIGYSVYSAGDHGFHIDPNDLATSQFKELAPIVDKAVENIWKKWGHVLKGYDQ